ncbi:MAG: APC family permease, partial [Gemmatimonadaceae bacterium]|nr:APC family permease [Gemmatimonadaceae bacterium]
MADDTTVTGESSLMRALGVRGLAATTFNVMIGTGIFVLPAVVAAAMGAAAPLAYLVCAAAMGLIVLCFAEAGSRVSLTGGPYAYVEVALGPFVGFLGGVLLWLVALFASAAVASALVGSAAVFWPVLAHPLPRAALLVGVFALLTAVNVRGVRQGTRLVEIVTVAKLLPLLLLVAAGAFAAPAAPPGRPGAARGGGPPRRPR